MTRPLIIDLSKWQDDNNTARGVDFVKMRAEGVVGVIIRAGQGNTEDPDFRRNYAAAKAAGLARGVYWFFDSRTSPLAQAMNCAAIIGTDFPELGTWLDLEENYGGLYLGWRNWITCLASLRTKLPKVGVYTAPYYWMLNRPQDTESLNYFKSFDLWIAHYNVTTPLIPSPWTGWVFWQFTSSGDGLKYGAESLEIDLNYFNGDEQTFRNYFDLTDLPTEPGEQMARYTVTAPSTSGVALRPDHNTNNTPINNTYIPAGTVLHTDVQPFVAEFNLSNSAGMYQLIGDKWAQVVYNGLTGWVALIHKGANICTLVDNGTEPPPPPAAVYPVSAVVKMSDGSEWTGTFTRA